MYRNLNADQCLKKCQSENARGCEHHNSDCTVHNKEVSKGSGNGGYKCWAAPANCRKQATGLVLNPLISHHFHFLDGLHITLLVNQGNGLILLFSLYQRPRI